MRGPYITFQRRTRVSRPGMGQLTRKMGRKVWAVPVKAVSLTIDKGPRLQGGHQGSRSWRGELE